MLAAALRELAFLRRNPWDLAMVCVLPLVAIFGTIAIFSSGTPARIPVAFVDADGSPLSRRLERSIAADPRFDIVLRTPSPAAALSAVRSARVEAVVVVPHDTERSVLRGARAHVVAYVNSMHLLSDGIAERDLQAIVKGVSVTAAVRKLGEQGTPQAEGLAESMPIALDLTTLYNPRLDYMAYLADPLILAMLSVLVLIATVSALGRELRDGTAAEWLASAGGSPFAAVAGKLVPYFFVFATFESATTLFFAAREGWPHGLGVVLLAIALGVAAYQGLAVAIAAIFANLRMSLSVASAYASPGFAFAGVTFPQLGMPPFARWVSAATPLTYVLHLRFAQLQLRQPAWDALHDLTALAFFACFGLGIGLIPMGTLARTPRGWHRS